MFFYFLPSTEEGKQGQFVCAWLRGRQAFFSPITAGEKKDQYDHEFFFSNLK